MQLSLNRLVVHDASHVEVEAVSSPDRRGVAFGSSYPPSPKRQPLRAAAAAPREELMADSGGMEATGAAPALPGSGGSSSGAAGNPRSSLLAAALRLQGIGGRSVGLRDSRG